MTIQGIPETARSVWLLLSGEQQNCDRLNEVVYKKLFLPQGNTGTDCKRTEEHHAAQRCFFCCGR